RTRRAGAPAATRHGERPREPPPRDAVRQTPPSPDAVVRERRPRTSDGDLPRAEDGCRDAPLPTAPRRRRGRPTPPPLEGVSAAAGHGVGGDPGSQAPAPDNVGFHVKHPSPRHAVAGVSRETPPRRFT